MLLTGFAPKNDAQAQIHGVDERLMSSPPVRILTKNVIDKLSQDGSRFVRAGQVHPTVVGLN